MVRLSGLHGLFTWPYGQDDRRVEYVLLPECGNWRFFSVRLSGLTASFS
jgi:hypothetical protein